MKLEKTPCTCCPDVMAWFFHHIDPDKIYIEAIVKGDIDSSSIKEEIAEYNQHKRDDEKLDQFQQECMELALTRLLSVVGYINAISAKNM